MMSIFSFFLLASVSYTTFGILREPIDLGHGYDMNTIVYPGGAPFKYLKQTAGLTSKDNWFAANDFATAEHCGTHLDAPYHFNKNGRKVGEIPLNKLLTKAILVDAVAETGNNANYTLPASKLTDWVSVNGEIPDNSVLLVRFGWSSRYPNKTEYMGPSDTDLRFPGLSMEAVEWIVKTKKIVGIGVDTASIDQSKSENYPVHTIAMGNDIYGLENLNLSFDLPTTFDVIVMPIKLVNGTGGPARVIAH